MSICSTGPQRHPFTPVPSPLPSWDKVLQVPKYLKHLEGDPGRPARVVVEVRYFGGPNAHMKAFLDEIDTADKAMLSTGSFYGLDCESERARETEFGLICLWDLTSSELKRVIALNNHTISVQDDHILLFGSSERFIIKPRKIEHMEELRTSLRKQAMLGYTFRSGTTDRAAPSDLVGKALVSDREFLAGICTKTQIHSLDRNIPHRTEHKRSLIKSNPTSFQLRDRLDKGLMEIPEHATIEESGYIINPAAPEIEASLINVAPKAITQREPFKGAIKYYEAHKERIVHLMSDLFTSSSWLLTLTLVGSLPTVVILCKDPGRIKAPLQGLGVSLRFEVTTGTVGFAMLEGTDLVQHSDPFDSALTDSAHDPDHYARPDCGISVGMDGISSSGTMGGFVHDTKTKEAFGLTAGHVLAMDLKGKVEKLPFTRTEQSREVVSNSHQDHQHCLSLLRNAIQVMRTTYDKSLAKDGRLLKRIRGTESLLEKQEALERSLGYVQYAYYGIGAAKDGRRCWEDVGLIAIDAARLGKSKYEGLAGLTRVISGYCPLYEGMKVLKGKGRTSKEKKGEINAIWADCGIVNALSPGREVLLSTEWTAISEFPLRNELALAGDSGSLIITQDCIGNGGEQPVVGLLFAMGRRGVGVGRKVALAGFEVAMIIPADEVIATIKRGTGMDVEFGVWEGDGSDEEMDDSN